MLGTSVEKRRRGVGGKRGERGRHGCHLTASVEWSCRSSASLDCLAECRPSHPVFSTCLVSRTACSSLGIFQNRFWCIQEEAGSKGRQGSKQELGMGTRLNHNREAPMEIFMQADPDASPSQVPNIRLGSST